MRFTAGTLLLVVGCTPAGSELAGSLSTSESSASVPASDSDSGGSAPEWTHEALGGQASVDVLPEGADDRVGATVIRKGLKYVGAGAADFREVCGTQTQVTIPNTGSGWVEVFVTQEPCYPRPGEGKRPLLVLFHKFGSSQLDTVVNTDFFELAAERRWYVVAPLSAATKHYGSPAAQLNTSVVIDYMLQNYENIDRDRIYGVGFSMGGGAMLSYAARHVDPAHGMFAALLTHTGGGALWHTYGNSPDDDDSDDNLATGANLETPDILDFWFGGSPLVVPFEYQRYSIMDFDPNLVLTYETSMAPNVQHVPIHTWYAGNDPVQHLRDLTLQIAIEFQTTFFGLSVITPVAGSMHTWNTLNEQVVLDWLDDYSLQMPTSGRTVADADGTWFYFEVVQDAPGSFTPFEWSLDTATNTITVGATSNLQRLVVDTEGAGLDPTGDLTLNLSSADGTGDEVRFLGMTTAPALVLRDGIPDVNWVHDGLTETLTVTESDTAPHTWWIVAN